MLAVSCLFFVQVYRPLPPRINPTAVNKYIINMWYMYISTSRGLGGGASSP
jgi:hypothetical protein